jgi:hypothetical protein
MNLLPAKAPQFNTGFVIVDTTPQFETADLFVYWFFVGQQSMQDKGELVGSLVGRHQDDPGFYRKLKRWQGIMNMNFPYWSQAVGRISEKEFKAKSQEQKLQAALTKIRNKYEVNKKIILQSPSLFKDAELADLEKELDTAIKATTYNYRFNPKYTKKWS